MLKLPALQALVHELGKLPGIGPKSAERLSYHLLKSSPESLAPLQQALSRLHREIQLCHTCFNFSDQPECYYCRTPDRQNHLLCIVKEPSAIERLELSGVFRGRYHVLHGAIAPLMGITPDKLKIEPLLERIEASHRPGSTSPIEEIIFALDADLEGDTTVLYLSQQLQKYPVRLSRLAQGVPIGSGMDYLDERTLGRAIQNRVEIASHSRFDKS